MYTLNLGGTTAMWSALFLNAVPDSIYHSSFWAQFLQMTSIAIVTTFVLNLRVNRRLKSPDVVGDYQRRYDVIMFELRPRVLRQEYDACYFYERYWNLQMDQFYAWRSGFITDETYLYWMMTRRLEQDKLPGGIEEAGLAWETYAHPFENSDFVHFMNGILDAQLATLSSRKLKARIRKLMRIYQHRCWIPYLLQKR